MLTDEHGFRAREIGRSEEIREMDRCRRFPPLAVGKYPRVLAKAAKNEVRLRFLRQGNDYGGRGGVLTE
jgi:hypothetical protein